MAIKSLPIPKSNSLEHVRVTPKPVETTKVLAPDAFTYYLTSTEDTSLLDETIQVFPGDAKVTYQARGVDAYDHGEEFNISETPLGRLLLAHHSPDGVLKLGSAALDLLEACLPALDFARGGYEVEGTIGQIRLLLKLAGRN